MRLVYKKLAVISRRPSQRFVLPNEVWYRFPDPEGMEGLTDLLGKSEPTTCYRVHATVSTSLLTKFAQYDGKPN